MKLKKKKIIMFFWYLMNTFFPGLCTTKVTSCGNCQIQILGHSTNIYIVYHMTHWKINIK